MVGTLIRQLREDRALTQGELAELVGLSTSALVRIEREQARPRLSTLRKLADALIVDVRELTGALRGTRPRESEDDIPPIADLAKLKVADDSATTLRARDALQR